MAGDLVLDAPDTRTLGFLLSKLPLHVWGQLPRDDLSRATDLCQRVRTAVELSPESSDSATSPPSGPMGVDTFQQRSEGTCSPRGSVPLTSRSTSPTVVPSSPVPGGTGQGCDSSSEHGLAEPLDRPHPEPVEDDDLEMETEDDEAGPDASHQNPMSSDPSAPLQALQGTNGSAARTSYAEARSARRSSPYATVPPGTGDDTESTDVSLPSYLCEYRPPADCQIL